MTGQLRVNGKIRHLRYCTFEDQSFALKTKHKVHKYVNTAAVCVSIVNLSILNIKTDIFDRYLKNNDNDQSIYASFQ